MVKGKILHPTLNSYNETSQTKALAVLASDSPINCVWCIVSYQVPDRDREFPQIYWHEIPQSQSQ